MSTSTGPQQDHPAQVGPWIAAALTLSLALALILFSPKAPTDNSAEVWLPQNNKSLQQFRQFKEQLGSDEYLLIYLQGPKPETLIQQVVSTTATLKKNPSTHRVMSAATVYDDEVEVLTDPKLGGFEKNWPHVKRSFQGPLNQQHRLFRPSQQEAMIYVFIHPQNPSERRVLIDSLEELRQRIVEAGCQVAMAGQPIISNEFDKAAKKIEELSLPIVIAICLTLMLLMTRSLRLALLSFLPVALTVFATKGLLGLSSFSNNLLVDLVTPLLFVLTLASAAHIIIAFQDLVASGYSREEAAWIAAKQKQKPCLLALLTTAISFCSLSFSGMLPIQVFGCLSAAGLILSCALVLRVLPAGLALVGGPGRRAGDDRLGHFSKALVTWSRRHPLPVLVCSVGLIAGGLWAGLQFDSEPQASNHFPSDSRMRRENQFIKDKGFGLSTIEVVLTEKEPFAGKRAALAAVDQFAEKLTKVKHIQASIHLPLLLREANHRQARLNSLPAKEDLSETVRDFAEQFPGLVSPDFRSLRVPCLTNTAKREHIEEIQSAIQKHFQDAAFEQSIELKVTGVYLLLLETQAELLRTVKKSLLFTALAMEMIFIIAIASLKRGLAAIVPNALPVAVNFLVMRAFGMPLDVASAMTAAIALGIAVDDTIHMLTLWEKPREFEKAGKAIVMSTIVVGLGFLSLTHSDFSPTRHFAILCSSSVFAALFGDLLTLPALLALIDKPGES